MEIETLPMLPNLEEVIVQDQLSRNQGMVRIDPKIISQNPNVSQNFEAILKQLPGVSTNNELSAQYSVRGGNFDENLIYINDVEIYKPYLVRNGQQEGLSLINPDLVGNVKFSAGGFTPKYGDKLSSVLDVQYKNTDSVKYTAGIGTNGMSVTGFFSHKKKMVLWVLETNKTNLFFKLNLFKRNMFRLNPRLIRVWLIATTRGAGRISCAI